jgi:hypothetical protein
VWTLAEQSRVQELNEALNDAIMFSRRTRPGRKSGIGVRTWEGIEERLDRILELLCEMLVWEGGEG